MRELFAVLIVLGLCVPHFGLAARSETHLLDSIRQTLLKHQEVKGDFKQTRSLKDLKLNLESQGKFRFKLPLDLSWEQTKPFVQTLTMTPDKIVQKNPDGSEQVIRKDQQPMIFAFSSSFLSVFAGDKASIEKNFTYTVSQDGKKWNLTLDPKDDLLKKAIAQVKLQGVEFVEKVEVVEKSGNTTSIVFSAVK